MVYAFLNKLYAKFKMFEICGVFVLKFLIVLRLIKTVLKCILKPV